MALSGLSFPSSPMQRVQPSRFFLEGERLSSRNGMDITPTDVACALAKAKLKYVIVGAHAANAYVSRPRTTIDVDVIATQPDRAKNVLLKAFPQLTAQSYPVVIRLLIGGREAIDVIRPASSAIFQAAIDNLRVITVGKTQINIPTLECVLAMKFASMTTLTRKMPDRMQDAADFARIIDNNPTLDERSFHTLAQLAFDGGGDEALKMIALVRAGKAIQI